MALGCCITNLWLIYAGVRTTLLAGYGKVARRQKRSLLTYYRSVVAGILTDIVVFRIRGRTRV